MTGLGTNVVILADLNNHNLTIIDNHCHSHRRSMLIIVVEQSHQSELSQSKSEVKEV